MALNGDVMNDVSFMNMLVIDASITTSVQL